MKSKFIISTLLKNLKQNQQIRDKNMYALLLSRSSGKNNTQSKASVNQCDHSEDQIVETLVLFGEVFKEGNAFGLGFVIY